MASSGKRGCWRVWSLRARLLCTLFTRILVGSRRRCEDCNLPVPPKESALETIQWRFTVIVGTSPQYALVPSM